MFCRAGLVLLFYRVAIWSDKTDAPAGSEEWGLPPVRLGNGRNGPRRTEEEGGAIGRSKGVVPVSPCIVRAGAIGAEVWTGGRLGGVRTAEERPLLLLVLLALLLLVVQGATGLALA